MVDDWKEATDPRKHVFEVGLIVFCPEHISDLQLIKCEKDIAIATYLILLWKGMYSDSDNETTNDFANEPWKTWPRPPAGFIDLGYAIPRMIFQI